MLNSKSMDKQSSDSTLVGKQLLQPLKGFRDFLPDEAKKRIFALEKIKTVFKTYGFDPLETPALEYKEVLTGKYGDEADKLIYTFKDNGGRDVGMRYDQTVPTARVLATFSQSLPMPFKRYQIQTVWRAEKPQAGRYREFLQCDADIFGSNSPLSDAELISLSNALFESLGFTKFTIFINDRKILYDLMNFSNIPNNLQFPVIQIIDKLDRKSESEVQSQLINLGLPKESVDHLFDHLSTSKPTDFLEEVINNSKSLGVPVERIKFEARLARGLDYYTSTIFEVKIEGYDSGSVLGGGRYDNLIGKLSGKDMPAVGFALGFDRTIEAMKQFNLFSDASTNSVLVAVFSRELLESSAFVAKNLRSAGISTEIYVVPDAKLEKQLKYADKKKVKWFIIIGPEEKQKNAAILKNLLTGEQEEVDLDKLVDKITNV